MLKLILLILFFQTAHADSLDERQQLAANRRDAQALAECTANWQQTMARETSIIRGFVRAHRGQRAEGVCEIKVMDPAQVHAIGNGFWCPVSTEGRVAVSELNPNLPARIWSCRLYLNDGLDCIASAINGLSARCYDASGNVTNYPQTSRNRVRKPVFKQRKASSGNALIDLGE